MDNPKVSGTKRKWKSDATANCSRDRIKTSIYDSSFPLNPGSAVTQIPYN